VGPRVFNSITQRPELLTRNAAMRPDPRCQARAGTCHDATGCRVMTEKSSVSDRCDGHVDSSFLREVEDLVDAAEQVGARRVNPARRLLRLFSAEAPRWYTSSR
jgi:hypothetical protein